MERVKNQLLKKIVFTLKSYTISIAELEEEKVKIPLKMTCDNLSIFNRFCYWSRNSLSFLTHQNRRFRVSYKYQRGMLRRRSSVIMRQQSSSSLKLLGRFTSNLVCSILVTVNLLMSFQLAPFRGQHS
jgi:hypothetical protein